jgi:hypothetical protein
MKMQLWELKERVDGLVESHGDNVWINRDIAIVDSASGLLHVIIDEGAL